MKGLIEAFTIFLKYSQDEYPTNCSHDCLFVNVSPGIVSEDDKKRLEELGFTESKENEEYGEGFYSFKYGSC